MGLLKKQDTVVKEIAKKQKQKKKEVKAKASESPAKGKRLNYWIVQPAIALAVLFGLALAVQEFLFVQPLNAQQADREKTLALSYVSASVRQFVSVRETAIKSLAKSELMQQALNDEAVQQTVESVLKKSYSDLKSFYVVSASEMAGVRLKYPGLSFASVDLIRDASSGAAGKIEAFASKEGWVLQVAEPVKASDQTLGVVLALFDVTALKASLQLPAEVSAGQLELKPNVPGSKAIAVSGSGDAAQKYSQDVPGTAWTLSYAPDTARLPQIDRIALWLSIGVSALLAVIIVGLICRAQLAKVRSDLISATQSLKASVSGEGKKSHDIVFSEINALVNSVKQVAKESVARAPVAPVSPPGTAPQVPENKEQDDAPLFDDDLLDLDVLDEGEPAEGAGVVQEVQQLDVDVPQSVFRAYDIRGVVGESLNPAVVELIGRAFASEALSQGHTNICVGYDGRLSSEEYCEALTRGIISTGADAVIVGRVPTPVLYFATHHLDTGTGVMITGSHNPSNYNGFKMMIGGNTLANDDIQKLYKRIVVQDFKDGQGARTERAVDRDYLDTILNDIAVAAPLKVVVDAGNGVAGELGPSLIEELGCEVIPLYCEIDGTFPNHHPDPGKPKNLQDLIAAVQEHDADLGLAFDGDGDRVGVVTNTGKIIWPDRLLMLFAKDVVSRNPGADIIFDVKCSRRLNGLISGYGGRPIMWKTGHSLIKAKMKETGALLAGEMSGHIFFKERWLGFDDGLYSAARLLEILGVEDATSDDVFANFPEDVSTPEINVEVTDENKFMIVEKLCQLKGNFSDGNVSTIDGLRVDFQNGWGLCRASNTTPMLVLRFEADDSAALEEIKEKFKAQLAVVEPGLNLDF